MDKKSLLESFVPGSALPVKETMLKIYGYGVTDPEYVETALNRLEELGISSARDEYKKAVDDWRAWRTEQEMNVSEWLRRRKEMEEINQARRNYDRQACNNENGTGGLSEPVSECGSLAG